MTNVTDDKKKNNENLKLKYPDRVQLNLNGYLGMLIDTYLLIVHTTTIATTTSTSRCSHFSAERSKSHEINAIKV